MIKKIALVSLIGVALVWAALVWGGVNRINTTFTGTMTGGATSQDSIYTDTHYVAGVLHYGNRLLGTFILDSITFHEPSGFGLEDSVSMVLKGHYGDQWVTIDSTDKVMDDTETCTLFVTDGRDTLYGEAVALIIRIADTVGLSTDSTATFTVRSELLHAFQD